MTTKKWQSKQSSKRWTPHAYQKRAVKFLLEHDEAALFLDPGLGKTSITYAAIALKKKHDSFKGALVVAPLRPARSVWPAEQQEWTDFHGIKVVVLHGPHKEATVQEEADVYVINPEGLKWLVSKGHLQRLLKQGKIDTLIIDELSKFKHPNTDRYKLLKPLLVKFQHRWGLTGSPAANGLMGLFGQCYMLDMGKALGKYITYFRFSYFSNINEHVWVLKDGAEQHIYERVRPLALRMNADDYLDLPQQLDHILSFELPPEARRIYDKLEDQLFAEIDDKVVSAANSGVKSMKLRQVASGAVFVTDADDEVAALLPTARKRTAREYIEVHKEKLVLVEELLEELQGQQLLVAYNFTHDLMRAQEYFGKDNVPYIGGGVSTKRSLELERLWNAGELQWLWVHPQSAGHGLNMQKSHASHLLWFTMTPDFELTDQLNRRLRRQGNEAKHLHCYMLVAKDTVEEAVRWCVRRRDREQRDFFTALQKRRAKTLPLLE
jgi:SNF2 family DNA or RNA helicase